MRAGGVAVAYYFVAFFVASECRFLFKVSESFRSQESSKSAFSTENDQP